MKCLRGFFQLLRLPEYYGNTLAMTFFGNLLRNSSLFLSDIIRCFAVSLTITAFAFAINDIEDADDDAYDKAKVNRNPISAKRLGRVEAWIFTWLLAGFSLWLAWPLGRAVILLTTLGLVLGFHYSYRGVRLKSMPVIDLVAHGTFLGLIQILIPLSAFGAVLSSLAILAAICTFATSVLGDLKNEIRDYAVDRRTHIHNTAAMINVRVLAPYLEILYLLPISGLVLIGLQSLPLDLRLVAAGVAAICGVLFLLIPDKKRKLVAGDFAQLSITLGIAALMFLIYVVPNYF